jgi:tetratricopeptide (TPR) repeat protein
VKEALEEAWKLDPGNFEVAVWLAHENGPGELAQNQSLAQEVQSRGEGMPEAALAASRILEIGEDAGTAGASTEALKRACSTGAPGCTVEHALRLARTGKQEEAAKALSGLAEKAEDPDLWRTLGDLYLAVENTLRAGQSYDKAAALRPGDPDILLRQGDCLTAAHDFKGARVKYEAARTALPDLRLVELRLGGLARQQGNRAEAVDHFRRGLGADTSTAAGEVALGRLLADQGMTQEAVPLFLDAASRDTASGDAYYYAAEALAADGKMDESEKYLRLSLERDPNNPNTIYQLARLLVYRGDREGGGKLLEQLAQSATVQLAAAALRDPLFQNDAPGAPLARGLNALYAVLKKNTPPGRALVIPVPPEPGSSASGTASPAPSPRAKP